MKIYGDEPLDQGLYGDVLSYDEAMQIVNDFLLVCQKFKSNLDEMLGFTLTEWTDLEFDSVKDVESSQETIRRELYGWIHGDKDITPLLIELSMGQKPLTGQGIYNLMHIAHIGCPVLGVFAPLRLPENRSLPQPNIRWCMLGEISKESTNGNW